MIADVIGSIFGWFDEARTQKTPKTPQVQMGVHFEEVSEMLQEISSIDPETALLIEKAKHATHNLAERLKNGEEGLVFIRKEDRKNFLDALCDQVVTATGCAFDEGFMFPEALQHVTKSNWSKFVDGKAIFDANGKIAKGPCYVKPDLTPFV